MNDNELGAFLRSRREAITPAQVGLPPGARRRTPGLRRSELATIAGVSVEYLTRLEQGRDRNPSPAVLHALAGALRLSRAEAELLQRAAQGADTCPAVHPPSRSIRPTVEMLLEQLDTTPAVVLNRAGEIVASTAGYEPLARPTGLVDGAPPSLPRFVFTDPRARTLYADWEDVADWWVAQLRDRLSRPDPHVADLADELAATAGPTFADRWDGPPLVPTRTGRQRLLHPEVGALTLAYEILELPDDDQQLLVHLPADDDTATALSHLTDHHPTPLRLVASSPRN